MLKTYQPKAKEITRNWHLFDAKGKILGRLATEIARVLIGKHKKTYAPHLDSGDYAVVVNAKEVAVTGKKEKQKVYYSHTGYPGGLKAARLEEVRKKNPKNAELNYFSKPDNKNGTKFSHRRKNKANKESNKLENN